MAKQVYLSLVRTLVTGRELECGDPELEVRRSSGNLIFLRNRTCRTHQSTLVSELRAQLNTEKCRRQLLSARHRAEDGTTTPAEKGPRNIDIDILLLGTDR
jgi:hypothetical protein